MRWRYRELLVEAFRGMGSRLYVFGAITTLILIVVSLLTVIQAENALKQGIDRANAGGLVWSASAITDQVFDGGVCESLNHNSGVAAAGGIVAGIPATLSRLPDSPPLSVLGITPNLLRVWNPVAPTSGLIVGSELEELGRVSVASTVIDETGKLATVTARTPPHTQSSQLLSSLLVVVAPVNDIQECWIRMTPGSISHAEEMLRYSFPEASTIVPYLPETVGIASPSSQWHAFADIQPWAAAGALAGIIIFMSTWTRRSELAIYRMFGTSRSNLNIMLATQTMMIIIPAIGIATIVVSLTSVAIYGPLGPDLVTVISKTIGSTILLALSISMATNPLATTGNLTNLLKDR